MRERRIGEASVYQEPSEAIRRGKERTVGVIARRKKGSVIPSLLPTVHRKNNGGKKAVQKFCRVGGGHGAESGGRFEGEHVL